jgi:hypothetical protein
MRGVPTLLCVQEIEGADAFKERLLDSAYRM